MDQTTSFVEFWLIWAAEFQVDSDNFVAVEFVQSFHKPYLSVTSPSILSHFNLVVNLRYNSLVSTDHSSFVVRTIRYCILHEFSVHCVNNFLISASPPSSRSNVLVFILFRAISFPIQNVWNELRNRLMFHIYLFHQFHCFGFREWCLWNGFLLSTMFRRFSPNQHPRSSVWVSVNFRRDDFNLFDLRILLFARKFSTWSWAGKRRKYFCMDRTHLITSASFSWFLSFVKICLFVVFLV